MADIQSWMRKTIQPVRTRTPTLLLTSDERGGTYDGSSVSESGIPQRRSGPRKKISFYFSHRPSKHLDDLSADVWSSSTSGDDVLTPDISTMVDAIFIKLCSQPFDGLPAQMNSSILHIIEAHRGLSVEKEQMEDQLEDISSRLVQAEKAWEIEELAYRAEIKRLELVIARGKNGMSRLMATRQDSVVSRKRNFRTQTGPFPPAPRDMSSQRKPNAHSQAIHQVQSMSPSSRERALSLQFSSAVDHAVPIGTPPQRYAFDALGRTSAFQSSPSNWRREMLSEDHNVCADATATSNRSVDNLARGLEKSETLAATDKGRDFQDIRRMASAIAANRGLKVELILPKLIELFDNAEEQLEIPAKLDAMQSTPTGPQTRRPPSWIPGDDISAWRDSGTIPTIRPPLRTIDSFASSRCEVLSDLSASSSEEFEDEPALKRPSKIPSPTHDKGLARSRQEQRSSVATVVGGTGRSETEMLSSSAGSGRTAFRNSSDRLDAGAALSNRSLQQRLPTTSRHSLSVSTAQGGATSSPDAPTADSTAAAPQRGSPPPVTGRTSGQLPLKQKTNQVDSAVGVAGTRAARSLETTVSRIDPVKDGARPRRPPRSTAGSK